MAGRDGADRLDSYARRVRSGDADNLEGQAAAFYFTQLFGQGFLPRPGTLTNAALDYGYAVLRGAIARGLVAHGLHAFHRPVSCQRTKCLQSGGRSDRTIPPAGGLARRQTSGHQSKANCSPQDKAALVACSMWMSACHKARCPCFPPSNTRSKASPGYSRQERQRAGTANLIGLQPHGLEC